MKSSETLPISFVTDCAINVCQTRKGLCLFHTADQYASNLSSFVASVSAE